MAEHIDVFISSTSRDLETYRDAVTKVILRLGLHPIIMEAFNPTDRNALQLCYDKVQDAEIFVGIYAYRYGYTPPSDIVYKTIDGEEMKGNGETGITHLEYLWALDRGIPMLLYLLEEDVVWEPKHIEEEPGKSRLIEFKNTIMSKHVVGFFNSPDNLAMQVATGLIGEMLESGDVLPDDSEIASETNIVRISGAKEDGLLSHFKDRKSQREEIGRLISSDDTRLISIIGRGGIGKTALVNKALDELTRNELANISEKFSLNGITYLSTRSTGISLERIFLKLSELLDEDKQEIADKVWISASIETEDKIRKLFDLMSDGTYILLLDNLEDLLGKDQEILDADLKIFFDILLRTSTNSRVILTSRKPLALARDIQKLDRKIVMEDGLPPNDAVIFLQELDPDGELRIRDADEELLMQIVSLVHGVPRALEIVASIMATDPFLSLEDLSNRSELFNHPEFVEELAHELYMGQGEDVKRVLEALAVLAIPSSLEAISYLLEGHVSSGEVRKILARLVQIHAIAFDPKNKLVALHPIDRDYIYNQIPE